MIQVTQNLDEKPNYLKKVQIFIGIAIPILGVTATIFVFWPGFVSYDSIDQYSKSINGELSDAHPIIMGFIWKLISNVIPGTAGAFLFQIVLFWLAISILYFRHISYKFAWLILLSGFFPPIFSLLGVIWKDLWLTAFLSLAITFLFGKKSKVNFAITITFLFLATWVRHNGIFAAFPLLVCLLYLYREGTLKFIKSLLLGLSISALFILTIQASNLAFGVSKSNASNYVFIDDLTLFSLQNHESKIPGIKYEDIVQCGVNSIAQQKVVAKYFCLSSLAPTQASKLMEESIFPVWANEILLNPVQYFEYRLNSFSVLLRDGDSPPYYIWQNGSDANDFGLGDELTPAATSYKQLLSNIVELAPLIFKPIFWLNFILLQILLLLLMPKSRDTGIWISITGSALIYSLSWLPVTIAPDFRYFNWPVFAAVVTTPYLLSNLHKIRLSYLKSKCAFTLFFLLAVLAIILNFARHSDLSLDQKWYASFSPLSDKLSFQVSELNMRKFMSGEVPLSIFQSSDSKPYLVFDLKCENYTGPSLSSLMLTDQHGVELMAEPLLFYSFPNMNIIEMKIASSLSMNFDTGNISIEVIEASCNFPQISGASLLKLAG